MAFYYLHPQLQQQQPSFSSLNSLSPSPAAAAVAAALPAHAYPSNDPMPLSADQLIADLLNHDIRETTLHVLAKKREMFHNLAPLLWHSKCTFAILLQEIVIAYNAIFTKTMNAARSNRVCNVLALFQSVATHPETRPLFVRAQMPAYLYPFLRTESKDKPYEYLRLTTLGVIGALVKGDDTAVITSLLENEMVPWCLQSMEHGNELAKTVATFIVQKILLNNTGLHYFCTKAERFFSLAKVLGSMVASLAQGPSPRLLKHIIRCYARLTDNTRACDALGTCLPDLLRNPNFISCLYDDPLIMQWLQRLLHNVSIGGVAVRGFEPLFH